MTGTLAGVSPSKIEDPLGVRSLEQAAVAGVTSAAEPDHGVAEVVVDVAEPSAEELAIARELVRSARSWGWR